MSSYSQLVYYAIDQKQNKTKLLRTLYEYFGQPDILFAASYRGDISYWDATQQQSEGHSNLMDAYDKSYQALGTPLTIDRCAQLIRDDNLCHIALGECLQSQQIALGVTQTIPESIRGTFIPHDILLMIGPHECFDSVIRPEQGVLARPTWSIEISSQGSPNDHRETTRMLPQVEQIQSIKKDLLKQRISDDVEILVTYN